jgi:FtsH-binding integral membrane protein
MKTVTKISSVSGIDAGLRSYLLGVYNYMSLGLVVSALCAYLGTTPMFLKLLYRLTPQGLTYSFLGWIVLIAPFVLLFMFGSALRQLNVQKAQALFWSFSALMGFGTSSALLMYSGTSLMQAFLVAAASFAGMSLYGYTTKKDLTGMGAFLNMGLWGLIFAMLINWFMKSPALSYAVSIIGVGIFVGLTAFHTQQIRNTYNSADSSELRQAKTVSGALTLYLDFINLFLMLLRLFGDRK